MINAQVKRKDIFVITTQKMNGGMQRKKDHMLIFAMTIGNIDLQSGFTVPAPIKGAPTIQKFLFWPSDCHIKNA